MVDRVADYVAAAEDKVRIVAGTAPVSLGGSSGKVPVSISDGLHQRVRVRLRITTAGDRDLSVGGYQGPITVDAGQTVTIKLSVHSVPLGNSLIRLRLLTNNGTPLPGGPVSLSVQSTQFGAALPIVIYVALGVLVLTVVARAVRRGLRGGPPGKVPKREGEDRTDSSDAPGHGGTAGAVTVAGTGSAVTDSTGQRDDVTDTRDPPGGPG